MRLLRLPQQPGASTTTCPRAAECAGMVGSSDTAARHAAARACARAAGALDHDTQHRLCVVYSTGLYVMTYFLSLATAATPCWAPPTRARPPPARSLARPSDSRPPRIFLCRLSSTSATPQRCPSRSSAGWTTFASCICSRRSTRRHARAGGAAAGRCAHLNGLVVWKMFSPSAARIFSFAPGRLGMTRALRCAARAPLRSGPTTGSVGLRKLGRGSFETKRVRPHRAHVIS